MTLRKLIAGNWKMHGGSAALAELLLMEAAAQRCPHVDVLLCPPYTLISEAARAVPHLIIGAQDCHTHASGAFTGNISALMLKDAGARATILGHSERRTMHHEEDALVCDKAQAAFHAGLLAIICVGESEAERDAGAALPRIEAQLTHSVPQDAALEQLVIAYEPIWAIGTGRTPSLEEIAAVHEAIHAHLVARFGERGAGVRILYGGSVKPSNAREILALPHVDGALVGGASLKAQDFIPIIEAA